MLSISDQGKNSLVEDVLNLDILPRLKELLCTESGRNIKCECLWILINISVIYPESYLNPWTDSFLRQETHYRQRRLLIMA